MFVTLLVNYLFIDSFFLKKYDVVIAEVKILSQRGCIFASCIQLVFSLSDGLIFSNFLVLKVACHLLKLRKFLSK